MGESIRLRPVNMDDADLILKWVNDPCDRANSFDSRPVGREEHYSWLRSALDDPQKNLYIMEVDGIPVGHIKVYKEGSIGEVGYCIAPECRGRGYAKKMIGLLRDIAYSEMDIERLVASVKPENTPSVSALLANGYQETTRIFELQVK